jgi:hypothetical protein
MVRAEAGIFADWFRVEPNDFDSAELSVFWHKNKALLLLVTKDGVYWLKKEAQDVGAIGNMKFFWFIILHFDAMNAIGMLLFCHWQNDALLLMTPEE